METTLFLSMPGEQFLAFQPPGVCSAGQVGCSPQTPGHHGPRWHRAGLLPDGGWTQINQMPHKGAEAKRSNKIIRQGGFRLLVYLREFRIFRNIHAVQPRARFIVIDLGSFQSSRAHRSRNERQL